jgi:hypothetical protein
MKKPINKFAVALWVLAAVLFASDITQIVALFSTLSIMKDVAGPIQGQTFYVVQRAIGASIAAPAQLAGLGVIVELIDQIRWNALQRSS